MTAGDDGDQPPEQPPTRPSLLGLEDPPKLLLGLDDDFDIEIDPEDEAAPPPPKNQLGLDDDPDEEIESDEPGAARAPDDEHSPDVRSSLEKAESLVDRARRVSNVLFKEARRMPEYKQVLATRERCMQFEEKLLRTARMIDSRLGTDLPDDVLIEVVERLANRIASWEHSPERQRERQKKQVAKLWEKNRGRDLQIVRGIENGESQRRVAARLDISRGAVQRVLRRPASDDLLKRRKPPRRSD